MNVDWVSATVILIAGLIAGGVFVYAFARRDQQRGEEDLELRDLQARRDSLVQQLREIEDGTPSAAEEKARLEREAADVLRKLDEKRVSSPKRHDKPAPRESTVKGFIWGASSMASLALLGWFVVYSMKERGPNDSPTGGGPPQQTQAQTDSALQQLEAAVQKNPNDLDARIELARAYLDRENLMAVFEQTQFVLSKSPNEPRAQTYQALVRMAMGKMDLAGKMLDSAIATDPSLLDAWVALAWLHMREGQAGEAEEAIRSAIKQRPDEAQRLTELLQQMRQRAASAPASDAALTVKLELAPGVTLPQSGVIFLTVRAAGTTTGPPVAAKRIPLGAFPMTVEVTQADSMMGQSLPEKMRVEARVDLDGNAMTRDAGAPSASRDALPLGAQLTLQLASN